jgi:hypothetical protein
MALEPIRMKPKIHGDPLDKNGILRRDTIGDLIFTEEAIIDRMLNS